MGWIYTEISRLTLWHVLHCFQPKHPHIQHLLIYYASFLRNNRTRCTRDTILDFHAVSHYQSEQQCELRLNIRSLPPTIAAQSQRVKLIMSWICPFMFNGLTENPHTIAPYSNKTSTQSGLKNWWLNLVKWNLGFVQEKSTLQHSNGKTTRYQTIKHDQTASQKKMATSRASPRRESYHKGC